MVTVPAVDLLRRQRRAVGLTRIQLARRLGVTLDDVDALEHGSHPIYQLVRQLAAALELHPSDLFVAVADPGPAEQADARRLIALLGEYPEGLSDQALLSALAVDKPRLRRLRRAARALLASAGLTVVVERHGRNRLRPRMSDLPPMQDELASRQVRTLTADAAAVLYDIVHAAQDRGWQDSPDPRTQSGLAELVRAGLIVEFQGRLRPSDPVIRSLQPRSWKTRADTLRDAFGTPEPGFDDHHHRAPQ